MCEVQPNKAKYKFPDSSHVPVKLAKAQELKSDPIVAR